MVLGIAMRRAIFVILGAIAFLCAGMLVTSLLSDWYARNFIRSDEDMNTLGKVLFLAFYPSLIIVGGWFGSRLYQKTRRKD